MLNTLKGMQNDKSPGMDGLPTKFYDLFWKDIKIIYTNLILYHSKEELLLSYLKKLKILGKYSVGDQYHYWM